MNPLLISNRFTVTNSETELNYCTEDTLPLIRQSVVVNRLLWIFFPKLFVDGTYSLRRISQSETLGIVTQVKGFTVEDIPHIPGIARVETHPRRIS